MWRLAGWSVINVFLGAMLGGSVFAQIPVVLKDPTKILEILGTALPASSNFFINYTCTQAFLITPFRCAPEQYHDLL